MIGLIINHLPIGRMNLYQVNTMLTSGIQLAIGGLHTREKKGDCTRMQTHILGVNSTAFGRKLTLFRAIPFFT